MKYFKERESLNQISILNRTLRLNVKDGFEECKTGGKESSQGIACDAMRNKECLTQPL